MKVLIVGAGMQGQVITWNLGRNPAVSEIVVSDYDEARAQVRRRIRSATARRKAIFIDASDTDAVAKAGDGAQAHRQRRHPRVQHRHHEGVPQGRRRLHGHGLGPDARRRPSTRPTSSR